MSGARTRTPPHDSGGTGLRGGLVALLVPPGAWLLALGLSYVVEDFTCSAAASADLATPGTGLQATLLVLHAVLLGLTALAGLLGWRTARRAGGGRDPGDVARFTAVVGAGSALVFGFGIVLIAWNVLVLEVCG